MYDSIIQRKRSTGAQTKVNLNMPQLTLGKLAQSGKHHSGSQEVVGSIPTAGNSFAEFILLPPSPVCIYLQHSVVDPGFPRGGSANHCGVGGGATYDFAKFSEKLNKIERIWTRGARVPRQPLRAATDFVNFV